jgi:hypothetical protein
MTRSCIHDPSRNRFRKDGGTLSIGASGVCQHKLWLNVVLHCPSHKPCSAFERIDIPTVRQDTHVVGPDGGNIGLTLDRLLKNVQGLIYAVLIEQEGTVPPQRKVDPIWLAMFVSVNTFFKEFFGKCKIGRLPRCLGVCDGVKRAFLAWMNSDRTLRLSKSRLGPPLLGLWRVGTQLPRKQPIK